MNTNDTQISPLRQRLLEDMQLRKPGPKSQSAYIRGIKKLEQFLGHSPHTTHRDIRRISCVSTAYGE